MNTKESSQILSMQNMDLRLRKVEATSQEILQYLSVIHRYITFETEDQIPMTDRLRKTSEKSEVPSDDGQVFLLPTRKKLIRSLTEVREDQKNLRDELCEEEEEEDITVSKLL